ncbi:hypothetical protein [Methanimicrococcus hacksteinii]|uniref:hypothetical protein n=1 Tax=Methanimicrococcus hacksteinii TaxID=3028293 RepID=UPI00298F2C52|nr:hypothetical protein [Methanimicrococcus sp. At1]
MPFAPVCIAAGVRLCCRLYHLIFSTSVRYANVGTDYLTVSVCCRPPYRFRLPSVTAARELLNFSKK